MEAGGEADWCFASRSPEQTLAAGADLARALEAERADAAARGEVAGEAFMVALDGALGAGKTVLVKGIASGLGIDPAEVTSPTFVIAGELEGRDGVRLVHADAYRVESAEALEAAGLRDWLRADVVVLEWAERFPEALPADRLGLAIAVDAGDERRSIRVRPHGPRAARVARRWRAAQAASAERGTEESGRWR